MVCFHIGVSFFGGGSDVTEVEFEVVAEVLDFDDSVVVKIDLGIVLAAAGKPGNLLHSDFFSRLRTEGAGKNLLLGLCSFFVVFGCGCDELAEIARELENTCGSIPRSTVACLPVVLVGVGKGRPRFREDEVDEGATDACVRKGLLDPGDELSADWLAKGRIVVLAPVNG